MATAPDLRSVLEAFAEHDVDAVVVEAEALTFMDAAGLTPLIEASQAMEIHICNPTPAVQRLLEVTEMDAWITDSGGTR